ncbi:MAG: 4-(cytidine 5'-diphospho)-2-C-methyl-D-erythritol kinase, partial [Oricola sp.]
IEETAVSLGADVPMCLASRPLFAAGVGEEIRPLGNMPALAVVLANPRKHVSTPAVFSALAQKDNPPIPLADTDSLATAADWAAWLGEYSRNDLQAPSARLAQEIDACLAALAATSPLLARMSGSGATCFGLYDCMDAARDAATRLLQAHPEWWITATLTGPTPEEDT